jgi:hypothetical protein
MTCDDVGYTGRGGVRLPELPKSPEMPKFEKALDYRKAGQPGSFYARRLRRKAGLRSFELAFEGNVGQVCMLEFE